MLLRVILNCVGPPDVIKVDQIFWRPKMTLDVHDVAIRGQESKGRGSKIILSTRPQHNLPHVLLPLLKMARTANH